MATLENIILRPLVTEKISVATDNLNIYGFQVVIRVNKNQIKSAVEKLYGVRVVRVSTMINPGKVKKRKNKTTKTPRWKKALVQVEEGQKIELFKGI